MYAVIIQTNYNIVCIAETGRTNVKQKRQAIVSSTG